MKVSIVIPVYNVERYLEECLNSAVNQTLDNIEIIAVNDGATDNSPSILKRYEEKYSNFRVINKENGGLSSARNAGLDVATGEYVYFLDSDDYILYNDVIEYCYNIAKDHYLDILSFDLIEMFDYDGEVLQGTRECSRRDRIESRTFSGEEFFYTAHMNHVFDDYVYTNLYRTSHLRENDLRFHEDRIYEDGIFNVPTFIKASRVLYIPYQFYFRRIRSESITTKPIKEINIYSLMKNVKTVEEFYLTNMNTLQKNTKKSLAEVIKDYLSRIDDYSQRMSVTDEIKNKIYKEIKELKQSFSFDLYTMGHTKVSVIIPVYNEEKYLEQCLDSIVNQTLNGIEIIAVNDGSTDSSLSILKRYEEKYNHFKVINKENGGVNSARNAGLHLATGEAIYFIDSHDYILHNNILEYCYRVSRDYFVDIVTFDCIDVYDDGVNLYKLTDTNSSRKDILESTVRNGKEFYNECIKKKAFKHSVWLNLYKREFLLKNNLKFQEGMKYDELSFNIESYVKAKRILYIPYEFYFRRVREGTRRDELD